MSSLGQNASEFGGGIVGSRKAYQGANGFNQVAVRFKTQFPRSDPQFDEIDLHSPKLQSFPPASKTRPRRT
jgi:hypothetical protein